MNSPIHSFVFFGAYTSIFYFVLFLSLIGSSNSPNSIIIVIFCFLSSFFLILSQIMQVPKGARSLSAILNEYVVLKEQQIALNQEKARADVLFKGLQEVLSVYHSGNQTVHNRALPLPPISPGAIPHSSAKSEQIGMLKYLIPNLKLNLQNNCFHVYYRMAISSNNQRLQLTRLLDLLDLRVKIKDHHPLSVNGSGVMRPVLLAQKFLTISRSAMVMFIVL